MVYTNPKKEGEQKGYSSTREEQRKKREGGWREDRSALQPQRKASSCSSSGPESWLSSCARLFSRGARNSSGRHSWVRVETVVRPSRELKQLEALHCGRSTDRTFPQPRSLYFHFFSLVPCLFMLLLRVRVAHERLCPSASGPEEPARASRAWPRPSNTPPERNGGGCSSRCRC